MEFIDLKAQYRRIQPEIAQAIQGVLDHGQYVLGPEVAQLEDQLARRVGVSHCIGVGSGTDALILALLALEIGPGDEVITSAFSFIATGEAIALLGAKPVFVDIDLNTYLMDPAAVEAAISPRTRAILAVSLFGQCADMEALDAIARRHHLALIEDGAQSFGATHRGRPSCGLSTIGCTSFFPAKPLGAYGEGGACFTNDDALAQRMRQLRNHGQDRPYHHVQIGINGRLDTLQAAVLHVKLRIFDEEIAARERVAVRYGELLRDLPCACPQIAPHNTSVFAQYTLRTPHRDGLRDHLNRQGIPTAIHYPLPLNHQPVFARFGPPAGALPRAEQAAREVLSLPMHPYLAPETQERIAAEVARGLRFLPPAFAGAQE